MIQNITFYWYYRIHSLNSVSMDIYMIMQMRSLRSGHTVLGERHSPPQTACSARHRQPVAWNLAGSRKWANLTHLRLYLAPPRTSLYICAFHIKLHPAGFNLELWDPIWDSGKCENLFYIMIAAAPEN